MKQRFKGRKINTKDIVENSESPFSSVKEAGIDSDNFIIKDVCLFGSRKSANDRTYTDRAIESIASLSDGVKCYINHPTKSEIKERDGVRDLRDWVGIYFNSRKEGQKVIADLQARESYFELLKDIAILQPSNVGNSINARVKVFKDDAGMESVADVDILRSVDLVSNAATTQTLFEAAIEDNIESDLIVTPDIIDSMIKDKFELIMIKEGVIQDKIDNDKVRQEVEKLSWTANDLVYSIMNNEKLSVKEKKDKIMAIFDDLDKEIKDKLKGITESDGIMEGINDMDMTLDILKKDHGDIIQQLYDEFKAAEDVEKTQNDLKTAKDEGDKLKKDLESKDKEVADLNDKIKDLESKVSELEKELDNYKVSEKASEKEEKINKAIKEANLSQQYVTDIFKKTLMAVEEYEEDGETVTVEEQIKDLISDRKKMTSGGKVHGAGEEFNEEDINESSPSDKNKEKAKKTFLDKSKK